MWYSPRWMVLLAVASAELWRMGDGAGSAHQRPAVGGGVELDRVVLRSPVLTVCQDGTDALCGQLTMAGTVRQFRAQRSPTTPAAAAGLHQHGDQFLEGTLLDDPGSTLHLTARPMAGCGDGGDAATSAQGCPGAGPGPGGGRPRWRAVRGVVISSALELYEIRPATRTGRSVVSARSLHDAAHGHEVLHYDPPPPPKGVPSTPSCLTLTGEPDEGYSADGELYVSVGVGADGTTSSGLGGRHARAHQVDAAKSRPSTAHTICDVFLDADALYLEKWGGTGTLASRIARTKRRMADTIFFADGLMAHPQNLAGALRLRIAGMRVHSDRAIHPDSATSAIHPSVQVLTQYQLLLGTDKTTVEGGGAPSFRGAEDPTSAQVCLNHLFTHQDFQSVLGVAYEASPNLHLHAGICEAQIITGKAMNIGLTSTMTVDGHTVLPWKTLVSTAHELGHNLGARHDCELDTSSLYGGESTGDAGKTCVSTESDSAGRSCAVDGDGDAGGFYLMYPSIGLVVGTTANNALLSTCSRERVAQVLAAKGHCLSIPTNQCAAGDVCCGGTTPVFGGAACLQDDGAAGGCSDTGTCSNSSCSAANGSSLDCDVALVTSAAAAAADSHVRRRIDRPACEISRHSVGGCTQPCGTGSSAEYYTCGCSGSGPAACGGAQGYALDASCNVASCDPRAPHRVVIKVVQEVTDFDDKEFQVVLLEVLGWQVAVLQLLYEAGNFETLVEVSSCRMFANATDCVPAATIKTALEASATKSMIESRLGYSYTIDVGTRLVDGFEDVWLSAQMVTAICFFTAIGGFATGVAFQCSKPEPPPRPGTRPGSRVSRLSSRQPSQQSSRMGSRQPSGYIDDVTISPRSLQLGSHSGNLANGPPLVPAGRHPGLPTITAESVTTDDNADNSVPCTDLPDYTQFAADLAAGIVSGRDDRAVAPDVEAAAPDAGPADAGPADAGPADVGSEADTTGTTGTTVFAETERQSSRRSVSPAGSLMSPTESVSFELVRELLDVKAELHEAKMDAASKLADSQGELRRTRDALQALRARSELAAAVGDGNSQLSANSSIDESQLL